MGEVTIWQKSNASEGWEFCRNRRKSVVVGELRAAVIIGEFYCILRKVYFSIISYHLHCAIFTWGRVPTTYSTHLKVLHNRSIRCSCNISIAAHTHAMSDLYHSCKILPIKQIPWNLLNSSPQGD